MNIQDEIAALEAEIAAANARIGMLGMSIV